MNQESVGEHKPQILVVDDDTRNVKLLGDLLSTLGYGVAKAFQGQEALQKVAAHPPDLILLDVMMPKMDGYEVCRRLKGDEKTRLIPIVMLTALRDLEDRIKGIEAGADDFLTKPFNQSELKARVKSLIKLKQFTDELENAETVIVSLALAVEARDPYTEGHCDRISHYSVTLGQSIGLPEEYLKALRRGGILHDIGKIVIPDHILLKPARLTPEEWKIMREHSVVGERICKPLRSLGLVLPIIRHHHEKWNGTGYPDGLKGEEIPITARILQVADVYDALMTERPYRAALPKNEALRILEEETDRGWWDRELVKRFIKMAKNLD